MFIHTLLVDAREVEGLAVGGHPAGGRGSQSSRVGLEQGQQHHDPPECSLLLAYH